MAEGGQMYFHHGGAKTDPMIYRVRKPAESEHRRLHQMSLTSLREK
jgi:hypothetical protein